jgi:sensor c-di-GMP phosphodiesterase-like protein
MKIRKRVTSFLIASAVTLVFFLLFLVALFLKIDKEINNLADYTYDYTKEMNDSIDLVLDHLKNKNEFESLLSMRIELFRNDYIRDIFYFKNDYIILSSVLGNVSIPQLKLEPDLIYNSKSIWFKHSVVYDYYVYTSSLIRSGNYGVLMNKDFYNKLDSDYEWELVLLNKDGYNHYLGVENLYNEKNKD